MKTDGISIPSSYTSWIGPLQSSKLYQEVRASADAEKNPEAHFETPCKFWSSSVLVRKPSYELVLEFHTSTYFLNIAKYFIRIFEFGVDVFFHSRS